MKSDNVKVGMQQAPHRSLFNALGMTKEEMERPLVGIVCSYNEIVPGHMNLDKIAQAVKMGVAMAGGTPVMFPAIAVCDGIAMGHIGMKYSLVTRDLIADSTEAMATAHQFDALVMIPNCDKNVPGLLMAAARVNVPTVFVSGGPMLAGHVKGHKTSLSSMFEAVGAQVGSYKVYWHAHVDGGEGLFDLSLRLFHEADVAHITDHGAIVLFYATAIDEFLHPFGENCGAFAFFSTDALDGRKGSVFFNIFVCNDLCHIGLIEEYDGIQTAHRGQNFDFFRG